VKNNSGGLTNWVGKVHLWLGLTSGLVVFIVAVTGCLYAFQAELRNLTEPFRFVEQRSADTMPPSALKAIAEKELPRKKPHAVLYTGSDKAVQVIFFNFEPDYYYYVAFLNPYTGEVLKIKDMRSDFFQFILDGHFYLWLPPAIGQPVVASFTLVFVVMMISGLILWWPRKKGSAKQRFTIKWNARWRRKNYDLHNVLGFYATWIAIILSLTGLVWGFQWFASSVYAVAGGEKSLIYQDPVSDTTSVFAGDRPAIDKVWDLMSKEYPTTDWIEVHIPEHHSLAIAANANPDADTYWQTDYRYFDQYTLKELPVGHIYGRIKDATAADKLIRMNYDIHTGAIIGLPGKVLAFFASLIVASLPITGFMVWLGRRNKSRLEREDAFAQTIASRKSKAGLKQTITVESEV
jgi:uncharacterized iron-regulated membrane protein